MSTRDCPQKKSQRANHPEWFECRAGKWVKKPGAEPNIPCSEKSRLKSKPGYRCNPMTGKYTNVPLGAKTHRKLLPGAPKRPLTAYMRWVKDNRASVKEANPGLTAREIARTMGGMWTSLSPAQKQQYIDAFNAENVAYKTAKETWGVSNPMYEVEIGKPRLHHVKREGPKKPLTSYMLWSLEYRKTMDMSGLPLSSKGTPDPKAVAKRLGEIWKSLPEAEQNRYKAMAEQLKSQELVAAPPIPRAPAPRATAPPPRATAPAPRATAPTQRGGKYYKKQCGGNNQYKKQDGGYDNEWYEEEGGGDENKWYEEEGGGDENKWYEEEGGGDENKWYEEERSSY